jgi:hypothetical protein
VCKLLQSETMPFDCQLFSDRRAYYPCWTGEAFESMAVFQVSESYIKSVNLNTPVSGTLRHRKVPWAYGVGIYFHQETGRIFYASNRSVLRMRYDPSSDWLWTSWRLYDLAQKNDRERQALKDAFAEVCGSRLSIDALRHIFRFC